VKDTNVILTCTSIWYYSRRDEDAFFEWIKKIDCIEEFSGAGRDLYLQIITDDLHEGIISIILSL